MKKLLAISVLSGLMAVGSASAGPLVRFQAHHNVSPWTDGAKAEAMVRMDDLDFARASDVAELMQRISDTTDTTCTMVRSPRVSTAVKLVRKRSCIRSMTEDVLIAAGMGRDQREILMASLGREQDL